MGDMLRRRIVVTKLKERKNTLNMCVYRIVRIYFCATVIAGVFFGKVCISYIVSIEVPVIGRVTP